MGFQQGLAGLNAAARNLDVIGNNVANTNTIGFKASRAEFADVYATTVYGVGNATPGIGVSVSDLAQQFTQGDLTTTNNSLDVAINGGGFYRISGGGSITYTRNGQFQLDKDGYIVNSDAGRLTGYPVDQNGVVNNGVPQELRMDTADIPPQVTAAGLITMNLDARTGAATVPFDVTDGSSYNGGSSIAVIDSLGREHSLALYFSGRQGGDFAVYIESTAALADIESHLLDVFCSNVAICSENVRLVERLRTAAYVDDLTRLPNRVAQIEEIDRLGKVSRSPDRVVGLIDIDEFSETIDAFGYLFGDRQLQAVAARLHAASDEPFDLGGTEVSASASIGHAVFPDHAGDLAALLRIADRSMYRVKASARAGAPLHRVSPKPARTETVPL